MPINYKNYPKDWKTRIRPEILARAKNRCENCGAENYKPNPTTGSRVILTISHQDHDTKNNAPENLKALCQKCHLSWDAKEKARRRAQAREKGQFSKSYENVGNKIEQRTEGGSLFQASPLGSTSEKDEVLLRNKKKVRDRTEGGSLKSSINREKKAQKNEVAERGIRFQGDFSEFDKAEAWFKNLPKEEQEAVRKSICLTLGMLGARWFDEGRFGRGLQAFLLKERRKRENGQESEKAT